MKIIASGDLHIGTRHTDTYPHLDRRIISSRVLYDMIYLCRKYDARTMILDGDVVDKAFPDLQTLLEIVWALQEARVHGITVYWIRGNHEVYLTSHLAVNVMHLYGSLCEVVSDPRSIVTSTTAILMIPWLPDDGAMKRLYEEAAMLVAAEKRNTLLFTHVALREGRLSASNKMLAQPISIVDLHPEVWNAIFLADYHAHQMLADNACYMGAPVAHTFGDDSIVGPWVIDTDTCEFFPVDLYSLE
jgi:hypothetical protein